MIGVNSQVGGISFYISNDQGNSTLMKVYSDFYVLKCTLVEKMIKEKPEADIVLPSFVSMKEFEILHKHITEVDLINNFLQGSQCILTSLKIYTLARCLELNSLRSLMDSLFAPDRLILNRVLILWSYSKTENDLPLQSAVIDILIKNKFECMKTRKVIKNNEALQYIKCLKEEHVVELLRVNQKLRSGPESKIQKLYLDEKEIMHVLYYYLTIKYQSDKANLERKLKDLAEELIDSSTMDLNICLELKSIFGVDVRNRLREIYTKQSRSMIQENKDIKKRIYALKEENQSLLEILKHKLSENKVKKGQYASVLRKEIEVFDEIEACDPIYIQKGGKYLVSIQFFIDSREDTLIENFDSPTFNCSFYQKLNEKINLIVPCDFISFLFHGYHTPYMINNILDVEEDESLLFTYCSGVGVNIKDLLVSVKKLE